MNAHLDMMPVLSTPAAPVSRAQAGYTLVELMIALTLGLLIAAAATQLFMGGVLNFRMQQAGGDVEDNGTFGIDFLTQRIRMVNYGNDSYPFVTDSTPWGGIVLSADIASGTTTSPYAPSSNLPAVQVSGSYVPPALLSSSPGSMDTVSTVANYWQGLSNVTSSGTSIGSDQLTISFGIPPTQQTMADCEGNIWAPPTIIVERFYLRPDTVAGGSSGTKVQNLVLACNASTLASAPASPATQPLNNAGGAGQVIMNRVDQFHVMLGTISQDGNNTRVYYTIDQYKLLAKNMYAAIHSGTSSVLPPRIVAVKLQLLVRSLDNTSNVQVDPTKSYLLYDQTVTPVAETNQNTNRYVRQVYQTTVALRNAMGYPS